MPDMKKVKIYHDKDGKIYTYDKQSNVQYLFEVRVSEGDNVAEVINRLLKRAVSEVHSCSPCCQDTKK